MPYKDPNKRKEASKRNYESNKETVKSRSTKRREGRKDWFQGLLDNLSCVACEESANETLDFHHFDPSEKEDRVGRLIHNLAPMNKVITEIEKCVPLCANCHRKFHAGNLSFEVTEDHKIKIPKRLQIW